MSPQAFCRLVGHLHRLGPRATAEFLDKLGARYLIRTGIEQQLEDYGRLNPKTLAAIGGDRFPPPAIHLVRDDQR
jgi:hypothetical protein